MKQAVGKKPSHFGRRRQFVCACCRRTLPFCLNCPCGFQICEECFKENQWGLSNGPTWVCPDCGRIRMTV